MSHMYDGKLCRYRLVCENPDSDIRCPANTIEGNTITSLSQCRHFVYARGLLYCPMFEGGKQ